MKLKNKRGRRKSFEGTACRPPSPAVSGLFSQPALITFRGCWGPGCQDRATPLPRPSTFQRQQDRDRQRFRHTRVLSVLQLDKALSTSTDHNPVFSVGKDCWERRGGVPVDNHSFILQVSIIHSSVYTPGVGLKASRVPFSSNHQAHCPS